jgi:hypothetical protein
MSYRRPHTMRQLRWDVPVQALALTACSANGLSYTFIGSPSGEDLRNTFGWSVGATYAVLQPLLVLAFVRIFRGCYDDHAGAARSRGADRRGGIQAPQGVEVTRGLTNGAAD